MQEFCNKGKVVRNIKRLLLKKTRYPKLRNLMSFYVFVV